jgi:hypothetical protein
VGRFDLSAYDFGRAVHGYRARPIVMRAWSIFGFIELSRAVIEMLVRRSIASASERPFSESSQLESIWHYLLQFV